MQKTVWKVIVGLILSAWFLGCGAPTDPYVNIAEAERELVYSSAVLAENFVLEESEQTRSKVDPDPAFQRELVKLSFVYWVNSHSNFSFREPTTFLDLMIPRSVISDIPKDSRFLNDPLFLGDDFFQLEIAEQKATLRTRLGGEPVSPYILADSASYQKLVNLFKDWVLQPIRKS